MKRLAPKISRYILGLIYFVFGAAGLFNLLPQPPPESLPPALSTFMAGIMATGYFFPFLKITETVCGLLLLIGVAPALALIILAPITLNIVLLHAFVTPGLENMIVPLIVLISHVTAATAYWHLYRPLFQRHKSI